MESSTFQTMDGDRILRAPVTSRVFVAFVYGNTITDCTLIDVNQITAGSLPVLCAICDQSGTV